MRYVDGKEARRTFAQEMAREVARVKRQDETRREFMTLYMEYQKQRRAGVEEGIAQGRELGIAQMAKKLLRAGMTIPAVAQMAEMPEETIRRIAEEDGIPAS